SRSPSKAKCAAGSDHFLLLAVNARNGAASRTALYALGPRRLRSEVLVVGGRIQVDLINPDRVQIVHLTVDTDAPSGGRRNEHGGLMRPAVRGATAVVDVLGLERTARAARPRVLLDGTPDLVGASHRQQVVEPVAVRGARAHGATLGQTP